MAIGVEKVKDSGYQGLVGAGRAADRRHRAARSPRPRCSRCARPAYGKKYGVDDEQMREVLARISWKNHYNGARNPRAQFRKEVSMETICNAPLMAGRPRRVRLLGRRRRQRGGDRRAGRGRAQVHRQAALHQGAVVRRRQRQRQRRPRLRLHDVPRDRRPRPPTRTRRPASPTPATRSRWPRCTTASRPPSC